MLAGEEGYATEARFARNVGPLQQKLASVVSMFVFAYGVARQLVLAPTATAIGLDLHLLAVGAVAGLGSSANRLWYFFHLFSGLIPPRLCVRGVPTIGVGVNRNRTYLRLALW